MSRGFARMVLRLVPDRLYLRLRFFLRTGRFLRLRSPRMFSEKLQWLKLHDRRGVYSRMVDKYEVKGWVEERLGPGFTVPALGVWYSFDDIDFGELPDQFVLKCTHDSGSVVVCEDKRGFDIGAAREVIVRGLARNYFYSGREWPYRDVAPRVLAEVYIPSWVPVSLEERAHYLGAGTVTKQVVDYSFYCFHGVPRFVLVSSGLMAAAGARRSFLTLGWEPLDFTRDGYVEFDELPPRPELLGEMVEMAGLLSEGIPFVRVDLFEHLGQLLVSEMTFFPASGMKLFVPRAAEYGVGDLLNLTNSI